MKYSKTLCALFFTLITFGAHAKIWRVNNNIGVAADFTTFNAALTAASAVVVDTIHIEASATSYGGATLNKRVVVIGVGYLLNPGSGGNGGLQVGFNTSILNGLSIVTGANNSKFIGINFLGAHSVSVSVSPYNIIFEKCVFPGVFFTAGSHDGITLRKCYAAAGFSITGGSLSNCVVENCIIVAPGQTLSFDNFTATGCIIRNNVIKSNLNTVNAYVANNIFITGANIPFTNCNVKNNLFSNAAQTLPGGAVSNQLGVIEANVFTLTGSDDGRFQLKAGSPALGAGVTIAAYTPDCGAYGGTDPYKLSGIPAVPSIYLFTVPVSIPSGSPSMNVTFSSRNNN